MESDGEAMPIRKGVRRLTKKAKRTFIEQYSKGQAATIKNLDSLSHDMRKLMTTGVKDLTIIQEHYKEWMMLYERILQEDDDLQYTLHEDDHQALLADDNITSMTQHKVSFNKFKSEVETYILDIQKSLHSINDNASIVSRTSRHSRSNSHISVKSNISAKAADEQRRAELIVRSSALNKKRELAKRNYEIGKEMEQRKLEMEQRNLELKMDEEELQLGIELAVAEARCKAIDDLDNPDKSIYSNGAVYELSKNVPEAEQDILEVKRNIPKADKDVPEVKGKFLKLIMMFLY